MVYFIISMFFIYYGTFHPTMWSIYIVIPWVEFSLTTLNSILLNQNVKINVYIGFHAVYQLFMKICHVFTSLQTAS